MTSGLSSPRPLSPGPGKLRPASKAGRNSPAGIRPREGATPLATAALVAEGCIKADRTLENVLTGIRDSNDKVRTDAWLSASQFGARAIPPLAAAMTDREIEVARAAKRGMWRIVRQAGRPGAKREKKEVVSQLISLLADGQPVPVRREVLWMLSEIGGAESIGPAARLLENGKLREDARMVLERIPGEQCLTALKAALNSAPADFKLNIAQSLRARGVEVPGLPCRKLQPTRPTRVKAVKE